MNEYPIALAVAALPTLGNFAGGLLSEFISVSQRTLSLALPYVYARYWPLLPPGNPDDLRVDPRQIKEGEPLIFGDVESSIP